MTYGTPEKGSHTWALNEEQSRPFIKKALELGVNFFDTANVYSGGASEEVLGRTLRDIAKRDEVVVATKVYGAMRPEDPNGRGLSPRLGMDYVDLYQIHRWDYETPIEETLEALHDVVKAGVVSPTLGGSKPSQHSSTSRARRRRFGSARYAKETWSAPAARSRAHS
jgi:aryl-alcohol dehydrogenase-like predicted oxidoreductase